MVRRAFTLIELLVVVAVIAILAAIAVPNFLEAMVRSKVSRTKADLRTISVGIETYRVDRNKYPPDVNYGVVSYLERLSHLTTPISYMTSLPGDPFADKGKIRDYMASKPVNPYATDGTQTGDFIFPLTYDYANRINPDGSSESFLTWARISSNPGATLWAMRGIGPDRSPEWLGESAPPYDPTNGSVSDGNIFWTGPGRGEDKPLLLP